MKLWIDDEREPPSNWPESADAEPWTWRRRSSEAIELLHLVRAEGAELEEVAFDHDLGLAGLYDEQGNTHTTRPVMRWMIENNVWPRKISIHSGNPVGARWLTETARQYAPEGVEISSWVR